MARIAINRNQPINYPVAIAEYGKGIVVEQVDVWGRAFNILVDGVIVEKSVIESHALMIAIGLETAQSANNSTY